MNQAGLVRKDLLELALNEVCPTDPGLLGPDLNEAGLHRPAQNNS